MDIGAISMLQLLQFADSALPVGSMSHSLGLEALVFDGDIDSTAAGCPAAVRQYLQDLLMESLLVDAVYCREAHARGTCEAPIDDLNQQLSALRLARESRDASLAMGRRFAKLAAALTHRAAIGLESQEELHHSIAFGYTLGVLSIDPDLTVAAFLQQSVVSTISAAQRLAPLGQMQAARVAWDLKPDILNAVQESGRLEIRSVSSFAHLPEMASLRHATLPSRLFIS